MIKRGTLIFEYFVTALLPNDPIDKPQEENPERVEQVTLEGLHWPIMNGVNRVSPASAGSFVTNFCAIPDL